MYLTFGIGTTIVNYLVFYLMDSALGDAMATVSNIVCFLAATAFAYVTNKIFVFRSRNWSRRFLAQEIFSFVNSRIASFLIEEVGIWVCANLFHTGRYTVLGLSGTMIAKIILSLVAVVINYFFSKYLVFRDKEEPK